MTDQRGADRQSSNPEPALKSKDRFILGAIVFAALIGGLLLYTTRPRSREPFRAERNNVVTLPPSETPYCDRN